MYPKAILLDLDDTIIAFDHGIDLDKCWKSVCNRHLQLNDEQIDDVIMQIKRKAKWFWGDPVRHRIGRLDLDKARIEIVSAALHEANFHDIFLAERIALDYGIERDDAVTLYPGAIETLQFLRELGIKLALITNGGASTQRKKIERFELASHFDCILIEEEFGTGKPDHKVYLHVINQLGVTADETWMIGDNFEWEVVAPQKLDIKGIWINHKGFENRTLETPFKTITTLSDIKNILYEIAH
ncbi:HAD family hydrolase [Paenibacillus tarimensis]